MNSNSSNHINNEKEMLDLLNHIQPTEASDKIFDQIQHKIKSENQISKTKTKLILGLFILMISLEGVYIIHKNKSNSKAPIIQETLKYSLYE